VISYQASSQAGARGWLGLFVDKSGDGVGSLALNMTMA
jgi:hypothetical protein